MMTNLKERIQALDDFQIVRFFEHFSHQLVAGANVTLDQIKKGIPESTRTFGGFSQIETLSPSQAEQPLEPSASIATSRNILVYLTDDDEFAPVIGRVLDTYRDDELVAGIVLAVGLVASVLLIAATTEFEGEIGNFKIKKTKADPAVIRAITEPFADILSTILKP